VGGCFFPFSPAMLLGFSLQLAVSLPRSFPSRDFNGLLLMFLAKSLFFADYS